ncbi:hypothetical protein [Candidatus Poriferisodalis sp.]|uniref:hypothetical protein n=1 Tax=Candidatus Poriferisodalis sp. TaxID=3101277 RepID=UPI003B029373
MSTVVAQERRLLRVVPVGRYRLAAAIDPWAVPVLNDELVRAIADEACNDPLGAWWKAVLAGAEPFALCNGGSDTGALL